MNKANFGRKLVSNRFKIFIVIVKSELFVDVQPKEIALALVEDDRLMEVSREKREMTFVVGNIYVGRVKKVMPSLNAVFVDVGYEKEAFLHYLDLGENFLKTNIVVKSILSKQKTPDLNQIYSQDQISKEGQISDYLNVGDHLLVQISKEPINTK